ncbi:MAG: hypothetical protein NW226_10105 [Microscillaceae bacterium]|nr:hypothetical protein [Microscillaceae bacterium]
MLSQYIGSQIVDTPLIRINIKHFYFADYSGRRMWDYGIAPATAELLKKTGLHSQFTPEGINIWMDADKTEPFIYFLEHAGEISFSFFLYPRTVSWLAITDILHPTGVFSELLYFTNTVHGETYLSFEPTVSQKDIYPSKPLSLTQKSSSGDNLGEKETSGIGHHLQTIPSEKPTQEKLIESLGKLIPTGQAKPVGWIHIVWDSFQRKQYLEALQAGYRLRTDLYELCFQPRKIYWRYWLILRNKQSRDRIHQVQILSDLEDVVFLGPDEYEIGQNSWAYCFISQNTLPFLERSPFHFRAVITHKIPEELDYEGKRYHTMSQILPLPRTDQIHWVTFEKISAFCADIKVFL